MKANWETSILLESDEGTGGIQATLKNGVTPEFSSLANGPGADNKKKIYSQLKSQFLNVVGTNSIVNELNRYLSDAFIEVKPIGEQVARAQKPVFTAGGNLPVDLQLIFSHAQFPVNDSDMSRNTPPLSPPPYPSD